MTKEITEETREKEYPFVKNRYFPGKLLHAADFTREQEYHERKQRCVNRLFYGSGVVNGLAVSGLGEDKICIQSGAAVDDLGRLVIVPEAFTQPLEELDGLKQQEEGRFILGLSYQERFAEMEYCVLEESEEKYHASRLEEGFRMKAYTLERYHELQAGRRALEETFYETCTLYEDASVKIVQKTPALCAGRRPLRVLFLAQLVRDTPVKLACRLHLKAKGGIWKATGSPFLHLYQDLSISHSGVLAEAELLAGGDTELPILLCTGLQELLADGEAFPCPAETTVRISVTDQYEEDVRERLRQGKLENPCPASGEFIPLSEVGYISRDGVLRITKIKTEGVRDYTSNPRIEAFLQRIRSGSGIPGPGEGPGEYPPEPHPHPPGPCPPEPGPYPHPPSPCPPAPGPHPYPPGPCPPEPDPHPPGITPEEVREILSQELEKHIRRGVTVIPVPKHCRNGRVLYSEEIAHGFPGEEVLIRYGRIWKDTDYAFWERDKKRYSFYSGRQELFPGPEGCGWRIKDFALKQNLEEGTFQIAVSLKKRGWRRREKEIAISWTAVKMTYE